MQVSISIVVPAQNVQRYIDQCLQSILSQLRPHHELIVVDDGSRDNTLARAFKAQEGWSGNNFHVFSQEQGGMASALQPLPARGPGRLHRLCRRRRRPAAGRTGGHGPGDRHAAPDVLACDFRFWHPEDAARTRSVRLGYPVGKLLRDQEAILNTFFADRQMYIWSERIPARDLCPAGRACVPAPSACSRTWPPCRACSASASRSCICRIP
ncbi:glycosyltransferase [Massilia sp. B-10]|nr:glycosyltransferase [Massilia sp. B-10]